MESCVKESVFRVQKQCKYGSKYEGRLGSLLVFWDSVVQTHVKCWLWADYANLSLISSHVGGMIQPRSIVGKHGHPDSYQIKIQLLGPGVFVPGLCVERLSYYR